MSRNSERRGQICVGRLAAAAARRPSAAHRGEEGGEEGGAGKRRGIATRPPTEAEKGHSWMRVSGLPWRLLQRLTKASGKKARGFFVGLLFCWRK